ncbi:DUF1365 domain-containing protein [Simiduia curdlanivorans]|uniref:DUF1365 domain-containing protein n=1 Tax=Simiduia curdlanivorans TaxID=1492769 RepID=A0ABV8V430_9GAMM|nr:DUF1365 domain-containing protein [Simiduia curdlanivorans]MDN3640972.1 DUF1365 domain-containing protein [Simiduia curdlanivorans]
MDVQLASGIYIGLLQHARWKPTLHQFSYSVFMAYVDLDEIPTLCSRSRFWSCQGFAPFWIRRQDYFGNPELSLKQAVIEKVQQSLGFVPTGPIRMLTNPRCFGLRMNPITLFYVFDASGTKLDAILAEVTNTPWDNRHVYSIDYRQQAMEQPQEFSKALHVSPFMQMQQKYRLKSNLPDKGLRIRLQNIAVSDAMQREELGKDRKTFEATLQLSRAECTSAVLNSMMWRFPWMTAKVLGGIYWQALKLWLKGARFYNSPKQNNQQEKFVNDVEQRL